MARLPAGGPQGESFTCPQCKEEFLTYSVTEMPVCPRCRQPVKARLHRRVARAVGLVLFAVLAIAGLIVYLVISQQ